MNKRGIGYGIQGRKQEKGREGYKVIFVSELYRNPLVVNDWWVFSYIRMPQRFSIKFPQVPTHYII